MSQDTAYADALRQSPVCVFKLKLLPYSLRHEGLMQAECNLFITESPTAFDLLPLWKKLSALDRATKICSNFEQRRFLKWREPRLDRRMHSTEPEITGQCAAFWNYLNASRCYPRLSKRRLEKDEKPGRPFGAPILAQLFQFVLTLPEVQKIRSPQEMVDAAWDYPFGAAIWRYFVSMELAGAVQIENDDEEETRVNAENIKRQYEAEHAVWNQAVSDDQRAAAIWQYPQLRDSAAVGKAVAEFEARSGQEAICPA